MTPLLPPLALNKHIFLTFHNAGHDDQLICWFEVFAEEIAASQGLGFEDLIRGDVLKEAAGVYMSPPSASPIALL